MFQKILQLIIWKNRIIRKRKFLSVDFNPIDTKHVLDIHKYLIKKDKMKQCLG